MSSLLAVVMVMSAACATEEKGEEEELLEESKADSQRKPTDHGPIAFGVGASSALTDTERYHAWTFELSANADLVMTTSYAVLGQRRTDTVLYLYKEGPTGWGAYIARNDDYGSTTYSQIKKSLGPGRYRALVKGYQASTRGKFKLTVGCAGLGCAAADPNACLFGEVYRDIFENDALQIHNANKITLATLNTLTLDDRRRLMLAVQQSSHTDVTTPEEAIMRVDEGEVNVTWLSEPAARRSFIAFEYGAGDNSYGAVFDRVGGGMVTNINDGDLLNCAVRREVCILPEDYAALRTSTDFERTSSRVITAPAQLSGIEVDQAIGAFRRTYGNVNTVADGLARVDDNRLNVATFRHLALGISVVVFEYGAGDTSVGAIYHPGTTELAGVINDLFIHGCSVFE